MIKTLLYFTCLFIPVACGYSDTGKQNKIDPAELDYLIFGTYDDKPTKINTCIMLKLTDQQLLRNPDGFFIPMQTPQCDTLSNEWFEKAQIIKKNVPQIFLRSTDLVYGSEVGNRRSVYVEFKRKGKKHSIYIHVKPEEPPQEAKEFYDLVIEFLKNYH